jgi:hypothetical protein
VEVAAEVVSTAVVVLTVAAGIGKIHHEVKI